MATTEFEKPVGTEIATLNSRVNSLSGKITTQFYNGLSVTSGYVQAQLPSGVSASTHLLFVQPTYLSSGIVGWSGMVQFSGGNIIVYVRQGTTVPANGSLVSFNLLAIKIS